MPNPETNDTFRYFNRYYGPNNRTSIKGYGLQILVNVNGIAKRFNLKRFILSLLTYTANLTIVSAAFSGVIMFFYRNSQKSTDKLHFKKTCEKNPCDDVIPSLTCSMICHKIKNIFLDFIVRIAITIYYMNERIKKLIKTRHEIKLKPFVTKCLLYLKLIFYILLICVFIIIPALILILILSFIPFLFYFIYLGFKKLCKPKESRNLKDMPTNEEEIQMV